ncbi:hypothetical protein JR316_0004086 [Psilocybe cubensis]|uniref:Uncharacterized protein n=2 Tax=Psilocybe cubensis TaxID=181762 RepID=A0ACB8HA92_PSICU|nr:hypothetical protein JR316_0004086 [Psilocybe cubensis]KAH9484604.1 hypothetical protein JR316_0004086 [Psilocybe cubensis]
MSKTKPQRQAQNSSKQSHYNTIYDETFRSVHYDNPAIASMANHPNLVGKLEHHAPTTDGSFSICIANGRGVFISRALLESIPSEHRPTLDTTFAGQEVESFAGVLRSLGTTLFPLILKNAKTGESFRVVLHAIVLPKLYIHMFIGGQGSPILRTTAYTNGVPVHGFSFDGSENAKDFTMVQGV